MIYYNEPIYNVNKPGRKSVFEVRSNTGVTTLKKYLRDWQGVLDRSHWKGKAPTDLSIILANRNIRKCQMLLSVKGVDLNNAQFKLPEYGRVPIIGLTRHTILKSFNYKCTDCGATKEETTLHIDHIIPISKGGSNRLENLQVLCKTCNLSKHTDIWEGGK